MFMEIFRPDQYQLKYVVLACESEQHESYFGVEWSPIQNAQHTAPERCQPEKFATPSFSAFLVVCDQDKKLQVGQQIL